MMMLPGEPMLNGVPSSKLCTTLEEIEEALDEAERVHVRSHSVASSSTTLCARPRSYRSASCNGAQYNRRWSTVQQKICFDCCHHDLEHWHGPAGGGPDIEESRV